MSSPKTQKSKRARNAFAFFAIGSFGAKVTQFNYQTITSIEVRFNLIKGVFEISAAGVQGRDRAYFGSNKNSAYEAPNCIPLPSQDKLRFERASNVIQDMVAASKTSENPQNSFHVVDRTEQIRKLSALFNDGIITKEEFEEKKVMLLREIV